MDTLNAFKKLSLLMLLFTLPVYASLPPEHEAARLMLSIENLVEKQQWSEAELQLIKMGSLEVELPTEYFFYNGEVLAHLARNDEAQASLEAYVVKAGSEGNFYTQALSLLTEIDQRPVTLPQAEPEAKKSLPVITGDGDGYIKSLQALYLTDDPVKALVLQVNSLLAAHAYTGSRVKSKKQREGIAYTVSVEGPNLLLQEKSYQNQQPTLSVAKLNVLGVDPFLKNGCSAAEYTCWVYHPSKSHERWILIDRDELVIGELTEALTKLIRLLQKGA